MFVILIVIVVYVTGFGKMFIVHTSDFAHLEIHKNYIQEMVYRYKTFRDNKGTVASSTIP